MSAPLGSGRLRLLSFEIAGRREAVRTLEEWLARAGWTPDPTPGDIPAGQDASARAGRLRQRRIRSATCQSPKKKPRTALKLTLVRLFFQEVFKGHPPKKWGYRKLHERHECVGHGEERGRPGQADRGVRYHHSPRAQGVARPKARHERASLSS